MRRAVLSAIAALWVGVAVLAAAPRDPQPQTAPAAAAGPALDINLSPAMVQAVQASSNSATTNGEV